MRALALTAPIARAPGRIFPIVIEELAARFGASPALMSDGQTLSYRALSERANQYSRWALEQGLTGGAVLALVLPNGIDYLAIWLGVTRVGGVVALVNSSVSGAALAHSLNVVAANHVIFARQYLDRFTAVLARLQARPRCWIHGGVAEGFVALEEGLQLCAPDPLPDGEFQAPTINDRALYIYTSGTSGLPKAVNVSHFRIMQWTHWFAGLMDTQRADRLYNCLPMHHSIGGVVAIGAPLIHGGAVVIRQRFSASEFWPDIVRFECTLFQYIGELCRYLLNAPAHALERQHQLRLCCGNGLRADVWLRFKERFAIPRILEYYASTEGTFSLYNLEEKVGAIGRIPALLRHRQNIALIHCDEESGEPLRDEQGLCRRCATGQIGEAIAEIRGAAANPASRFEGYTDPAASSNKLLRHVFAVGDSWYRTGDLMRQDAAGYFYFVDRMGDTYRWKGENVAASEVADRLRDFAGVADAVVYGVKVPGTEGRAGMAALAPAGTSDTLDLAALHGHVADHLPPYARPLFVRVLQHIPMTGTHKASKVELLRQGYDPASTEDALFFDDGTTQAYVPVTPELFQRLASGQIRL